MNYGMILRGLSVYATLAIVGSSTAQSDPQFGSKSVTQPHSPDTRSPFPCIQPLADTKQKNRVAMLRGPDWVLESSIKPSCLPERDVVFSTELGRHFLLHPFYARTRLWVTKDHDVTRIRIVESSGSEKQDMIAISFVTNHRCISRNSQHCSIKGGALLVRVD